MKPFVYTRVAEVGEAVRRGRQAGAMFLGAGTNLLDLMRVTVEQPAELVDVSRLSATIEEHADGLMIGAAATNTAVAEHRVVRDRYPMLSRAILSGASGQIRNVATVGGNILQRPRCSYFYDVEGARCNRRRPGDGCDALEGLNRAHAILGTSQSCVATHPSDMCVALAALGAMVHIDGPDGPRSVPFTDLHRLPGSTPEIETSMAAGELITSVFLPEVAFARRSTYRKARDRASYAFALVSVACAIDVQDGIVRDVRLALGGVAAVPWRSWTAEQLLRSGPADEASFRRAAEAELVAARPLAHNAFKVELATRMITAVLSELTERSR